jgi:hypothetical protein
MFCQVKDCEHLTESLCFMELASLAHRAQNILNQHGERIHEETFLHVLQAEIITSLELLTHFING